MRRPLMASSSSSDRAARRSRSAAVSASDRNLATGDSNVPFYKELANQGVKAEDIPVVASPLVKKNLPVLIPDRWSGI